MKNNIIKLLFCFLAVSCSTEDDVPTGPKVGGPSEPPPTTGGGNTNDPFLYSATENLKDVTDFPIGNIVSANRLASNSETNQKFKEVLGREFNSVTAENDMKMANIFRGPDNYDFSDGDAIVAYAKANNMRVHGHTLVWHSSIPSWLKNFDGTDEEFSALVEDYVKATVAHFAEETMTVEGQEVPVVQGWDVVNEVFEGVGLRNSLFRQRMGNDYAAQLFQWAREADPDVKLFYNDYNIAGEPGKRAAVINMVNNFKTNNIPIDGIGMQMHLNHDWPSSDLPLSVQEIADTGLLVHISELDVKANYDDAVSELTEERAQAQERQYQRAAYYYVTTVPDDQQYGMTLWGFRDSDSWLYDGGNDWPLIYNNNFETKIAHRGLIQGLKGNAPN